MTKINSNLLMPTFICIGALLLFSNCTNSNAQQPGAISISKPGDQSLNSPDDRAAAALATPITFYGKVIDENGKPIFDADVKADLVDQLSEGGTVLHIKSDEKGSFKVVGHGMAIQISASKEGYYYQLRGSGGTFGYSELSDKLDPHSDSTKPAIFSLQKIGQIEPLMKFDTPDCLVAKDGTPMEVYIVAPKLRGVIKSKIKVEAWIQDLGADASPNVPRDWHCRISVPGGGLITREGKFSFMAPENGYLATDEINMPASLGPKWRGQVERNYFVRLGDGNFARIVFTMSICQDSFFTIESIVNPSGSRNLEYEKSKRIEAP